MRRCTLDDQNRSIQRALCKANIDGAPPYGGKNKNFAPWQADINFLGGRARLLGSVQPYTALYAGVENYWFVKPETEPENPDHQMWEDKMTYYFQRMVKTWKSFDWHQRFRIIQMQMEGYAPLVFDDNEDNWRFKAIEASSILVSRETVSALDERCPYVILLVPYFTHELYNFIKNPELAEKRGWNTEAVKWAIKNNSKSIGGVRWELAPWETWENWFQRRDIYAGQAVSDLVWCAHMFVQEYPEDGKKNISHYFFTQDGYPAPTGTQGETSSKFLFQHVRRYESYDEACIVYFRDIGIDGKWHSVRGLSMESFRHDLVDNRLQCRLLDRAFIDSTTFFASPDQRSKDKQQQLIMTGSVSWLPAETQLVNSGVNGNINSVMEALRMFKNRIDANTASANPRTIGREDGKGEAPTKFQVQAQLNADNALSQGEIRLDYLTSDRVGYQMFKRATRRNTRDPEAKKFQEECLNAGIPEEVLYGPCCVVANRLSGYGSAQIRAMTNERLLQLAPMMPEAGKNNLLNDSIVSITENPELVARYNPPVEEPTSDDSTIMAENSAARTGVAPVIVSGQNNVNHLKGHIADAEQLLAPINEAMQQEGGNPEGLEEGFAYLSIMVPHMEEHMALLKPDQSRKGPYETFKLAIKQLGAFHGKLRQAIRTAQANAQRQALEEQNANALGAMDQAKLASMQNDMQLKQVKVASDIALKREKQSASQQLKTADAIQSGARSNAETVATITRQNAEAAAKIERDKAVAEAKPKNGSK